MREIIAFIISITFQLSGAILLLINNLRLDRKYMIRKYINSSPNKNIMTIDETEHKLKYNKENFINEYITVYNNRMSFIYIMIGYLMSIFSEIKDDNRFIIFCSIVLLSFVLILITHAVVKHIVSKQEDISESELEGMDMGFIPFTVEVEDKELDFHL